MNNSKCDLSRISSFIVSHLMIRKYSKNKYIVLAIDAIYDGIIGVRLSVRPGRRAEKRVEATSDRHKNENLHYSIVFKSDSPVRTFKIHLFFAGL